MAKGRNRSNSSGVFTTRSSVRAPATVRAGMTRPNAATMSPLSPAPITTGTGVRSSFAAAAMPRAIMTRTRTTAIASQRLLTPSGRDR